MADEADALRTETAATEAFEEAGVRGSVSAVQVGRFRKRPMKKKHSVVCECKSTR